MASTEARPRAAGGMRIAIVTQREARLGAFRAALEAHGFQVDAHRDGWDLFRFVQDRHWNLVVLDGLDRALLEDLLEADAGIATAVLADLEPQAFHEAAEGLGVLSLLPAHPGTADAEALVERMKAVGALDPRVEAAQIRLDAMSRELHPHCVVCWDRHPFGLKVDYRVVDEHRVEGEFACGKSYEGYENILHGGIVSALLDGAMASCILAKGLEAYTVELRLRYRRAVRIGVPATLRGVWLRSEGPLHLLHATLEQEGTVCASARAKFFEGKPDQPSQPMPGGEGVRHLLNQARKRLV